jgi:hypothetical protein
MGLKEDLKALNEGLDSVSTLEQALVFHLYGSSAIQAGKTFKQRLDEVDQIAVIESLQESEKILKEEKNSSKLLGEVSEMKNSLLTKLVEDQISQNNDLKERANTDEPEASLLNQTEAPKKKTVLGRIANAIASVKNLFQFSSPQQPATNNRKIDEAKNLTEECASLYDRSGDVLGILSSFEPSEEIKLLQNRLITSAEEMVNTIDTGEPEVEETQIRTGSKVVPDMVQEVKKPVLEPHTPLEKTPKPAEQEAVAEPKIAKARSAVMPDENRITPPTVQNVQKQESENPEFAKPEIPKPAEQEAVAEPEITKARSAVMPDESETTPPTMQNVQEQKPKNPEFVKPEIPKLNLKEANQTQSPPEATNREKEAEEKHVKRIAKGESKAILGPHTSRIYGEQKAAENSIGHTTRRG